MEEGKTLLLDFGDWFCFIIENVFLKGIFL